MLSVLSHSKMDSNQILVTVCDDVSSAADSEESKGAAQVSHLWVIHRPGTKHVEYRAKGALKGTLMLLAYDYATMLVLEGGEGEDDSALLRWYTPAVLTQCLSVVLIFERCACSWKRLQRLRGHRWRVRCTVPTL